MTRIDAVRATPAVVPGRPEPLRAGPPVLAIADLDAAIIALQGEGRRAASSLAESRSASAKADRDKASADARKAEEDARSAESRAGFWSKLGGVAKVVATVAAVVGGAAATVCSAGTAAPAVIALAGLALSMSSPYIGKACGKTAGDVAQWTGLAASIVGGGWSALATTGARNAALAVGTQTVSRVVEGGARVTEGVATIKEKRANAEAIEDQAEVTEARVRLRQSDAELAEVVELLKSVEASVQRALGTLHAVVTERGENRQRLASERRMYG